MKDVVGRGPPTMSNIAGLFHPWEREPERGGWLTGVGAQGRSGVREPREGATEGGAPIHQRPSTLAFPPLSFFSTVRAPSFRVTSALFHPSFLPPVLIRCRGSASPCSSFLHRRFRRLLDPQVIPSLCRLSPPLPASSASSYATDYTFQIH